MIWVTGLKRWERRFGPHDEGRRRISSNVAIAQRPQGFYCMSIANVLCIAMAFDEAIELKDECSTAKDITIIFKHVVSL